MPDTDPEFDGYRRILMAVDCSDQSNAATEEAVRLGILWKSEITGLHAYAAKLHDHRFKQMEGGLPEQYRKEEELERQRDVHDDLIGRGLRLITDAYLDQTERSCEAAGLHFSRLAHEGRNYRVVLEEAQRGDYDLLVLGAQGLGAVQPGLIGTVCERVVRRTQVDTLIVKSADRRIGDGPILVALDGSHQSFGGLITALALGRQLGAPVHAVAVYDPYFHYVAFNRIADVLSEEAGEVFRFEEQEKLHEEIIDSGLAKIYQAHLAIATSIAEEIGVPLETTLLDGKPYDAILKHIPKLEPSLLVLGKLGIHTDDELDIGGNTQHLLRLADCNLLISLRAHQPAMEMIAEETTSWTEEAEERMQGVPDFVRNMARMAILRYAQERGHTVITASIVEEATAELMPGHAHRAMQQVVAAADAGQLGRRSEEDGPSLAWSDEARELLEGVDDSSLRGNLELRAEKSARREKAAHVSPEHIRPFLPSPAPEPSPLADGFSWTDDALRRLERVPEGFMREASRERILDHARNEGLSQITLEVAEAGLARARQAMSEAMTGEMTGDLGGDANPAGGPEARAAADKKPRSLPWDADAKVVLERVPEGFMRELTAQRVEARAQQLGHDRISRERVEDQFRNWREHSEKVTRELIWDADAYNMIANAPPMVRGMIVREIEAGAQRDGLASVTSTYVEAARRSWRESGAFHVAPTEEY
jgi:nucleotide-binding universal stress UspA family protein